MQRLLIALTCAATLVVGPCALDSWKLAFGPVLNGETLYGGVELEFQNGVDFVIPVVPFGY